MRVRRVVAATGLVATLAVGATVTTTSAATAAEPWGAAGTSQDVLIGGSSAAPAPDWARILHQAMQKAAMYV